LAKQFEVNEGFRVCERGIAVESGSPQSVLDGLIYLAKDEKLRERFSKAGREFVGAEYSKNRLVQDIKELYRDLLAR